MTKHTAEHRFGRSPDLFLHNTLKLFEFPRVPWAKVRFAGTCFRNLWKIFKFLGVFRAGTFQNVYCYSKCSQFQIKGINQNISWNKSMETQFSSFVFERNFSLWITMYGCWSESKRIYKLKDILWWYSVCFWKKCLIKKKLNRKSFLLL